MFEDDALEIKSNHLRNGCITVKSNQHSRRSKISGNAAVVVKVKNLTKESRHLIVREIVEQNRNN